MGLLDADIYGPSIPTMLDLHLEAERPQSYELLGGAFENDPSRQCSVEKWSDERKRARQEQCSPNGASHRSRLLTTPGWQRGAVKGLALSDDRSGS